MVTTAPDTGSADHAQTVLRRLTIVWADFESRLRQVPIIDRALTNRLHLDDYRLLLLDHYCQVQEGAGWITRAASSITAPYLKQRSVFIRHAATEHRDYEMLERSFIAAGGQPEALQAAAKNMGSEALSAWMYQRASKPNPFDLIGAMFIIEGLGKRFSEHFVTAMKKHSSLTPEQTEFYSYHAAHDADHLAELEAILASGILDIPGMGDRIPHTARVTARLYLLQLEEMGNY